MTKRGIDAKGPFAVVSVGQIDFYDYRASEHPPVLHRKETFLVPTHPEHFVWIAGKDVSHEDTKSRRRQKIKFLPSSLRGFVPSCEKRIFFVRSDLSKTRVNSVNDSQKSKSKSDSGDDEWLRSDEARKVLRVSTCDLSHLRQGGKIAFRKAGNACLYSTRDCVQFARGAEDDKGN